LLQYQGAQKSLSREERTANHGSKEWRRDRLIGDRAKIVTASKHVPVGPIRKGVNPCSWWNNGKGLAMPIRMVRAKEQMESATVAMKMDQLKKGGSLTRGTGQGFIQRQC